MPFFLVGNAGSTDVGAVDPLDALADFAKSQALWFHVDAAYGGFFALTERGRRLFAGIERAHSITLDPHKGLFLPYGTGCLLARDVGTLHRAHSGSGDYMPHLQDDPERPDFCAISPELSRDFRGLRVWLPLVAAGVEAFRDALDEKLDLARWTAAELRKIDGIELVDEPQLSVVAFRWAPPELADQPERRSELNRQLLAAINRRRRVFLSGTRLGADFVVRICILNFRTHRDRLEMCLEDVRAAVAEIGRETGHGGDLHPR
jgi:aromatic-L-amino-acid decarboxylase